jgi:endoglucanase
MIFIGSKRKEFIGMVAAGFMVAGCITSPVWEYGDTKIARAMSFEQCENGMIEDAEDGDTKVIEQEGRDGYWYSFVDQWGSSMEQKRFAMQKGGHDENSKFAARISGTLTDKGESIYAGMGFAFTNPKTPFDISCAKGISFWAKGPGKVRFKIPDRNTDPQGDRCTDCYNDFGVDIYLQDQWLKYTVPFEKMQQKPGWGDRAPGLDVEGAFAVQWQVDTPGLPYDVWVDDIALVGCDSSCKKEQQ